jgi:hypothetical protein
MPTISTSLTDSMAHRARGLVRRALLLGALSLFPACLLDWSEPEGAGGGASTSSSSSSGDGCASSDVCGVADSCSPYVCDQACCEVSCSGGSCEVQCGDASECYVVCSGGNCDVDCGTSAVCKLACSASNCTLHGANAGQVELGCDGIASASLLCESAQTCTVVSSGASCSCEGGGCT